MTAALEARNERRASRRLRGSAYKGSDSASDFINYELDREQAQECAAWRADVVDVVSVWTELVEGGYRVITKYDDYSSSCAAFIIPDEGSDNFGYILTGRGGDAYRAIANALFKHAKVCSGEWSKLVSSRHDHADPDF